MGFEEVLLLIYKKKSILRRTADQKAAVFFLRCALPISRVRTNMSDLSDLSDLSDISGKGGAYPKKRVGDFSPTPTSLIQRPVPGITPC